MVSDDDIDEYIEQMINDFGYKREEIGTREKIRAMMEADEINGEGE